MAVGFGGSRDFSSGAGRGQVSVLNATAAKHPTSPIGNPVCYRPKGNRECGENGELASLWRVKSAGETGRRMTERLDARKQPTVVDGQ